MAKLVLKICCGDWNNASRDKRELSVCRELGMQTLVMAKGELKDKYRKDCVSGYDVLRFSTRPLGIKVPNGINRAVSIFTWAHYARKLKPDIISGHDIGALTIGYLSNIFRSKKATLIYDSHEFEIGRNAKRSRLQLWWITHLECFLMKRCAFSIMVNDAIADEVQKIHKLKQRPVVVRSTPDLWTVDSAVCAEKRKELLASMEQPKNFMLMYHGGVMSGRGVETLLNLVSINDNVCAVILGNGEASYMEAMKNQAEQLGVVDRVTFHPAVPIEVLWQYVGAADVGMITIPAVVKSYYYMLPNKLFENIQSETPVICSDFPAVAPIVENYRIGLTCDPTDFDAINECVEKMRCDKEFYLQCKENLKTAKQELCWEKEKLVLEKAYSKVRNV